MSPRLLLIALALLAPATAAAQESRDWMPLRALAKAVGSVLSYSGQAPVERPVFTSPSLGGHVSPTAAEDRIIRKQVHSGHYRFSIPLLPDASSAMRRVDVDGYSATKPEGDARLFGVSARYALSKRQVGLPPAAAIRAHYAGLEGGDVVDISSQSLELAFTRPSPGVTPYWGIGQVWVSAAAEAPGTGGSEQVRLDKRYLGVSITTEPDRRFALELDQTGDNTVFGIRASFAF